MNSNLLMMFFYIAYIYLVGYLVLQIAFKKILKQNNLFLNISLSWLTGNFILMIVIYILAFTNNLNLIKSGNFYDLFIIVLIGNIILLFKNEKTISNNYRIDWIILFLFGIILLPLILISLYTPMMAWDSLAMWLMKAKSFFYANSVWTNRLYNEPIFEYLSKVYPVGLPLMVSGYYRLINYVNDQVVQLYFLFYYINLIIAFFGFVISLFKRKGLFLLILVTFCLFILPNFLIYSHNGYADIPLSFVFLMGLISLIQLIEDKSDIGFGYFSLLIIEGASAALIKIEGYPFSVTIIMLGLIVLLARAYKQRNQFSLFSLRRLLSLMVFLVISIIPIILWQNFVKHQDLILNYTYGTLSLKTLKRLQTIWFYYWQEINNSNKFGILIMPLTMFIVVSYTYSLLNKSYKSLIPLFLLLIQFMAYTYAYIITPLPLILQLDSSVERLYLQILPSFFLIVFYQLKFILKRIKGD